MKLFGLPVIEHAAIPQDEAWIVRDAIAEELPAELRGRVPAPCVVTGNRVLLARAVTLLGLAHLLETTADTASHRGRGCKQARARLRQQRRLHAHTPSRGM